MTYAIDTDGTLAAGTTLLSTGSELRHCGTSMAYAAGLARRGVADDHPLLGACVADFLFTHGSALELITTACDALAGKLTWAARAADAVERAAALRLGAAGQAPSIAPGGGPTAGIALATAR